MGSDGLQVRNQLTLNDDKSVCFMSQMWIQFMRCRFINIYNLFFWFHTKIAVNEKEIKKKNDADIIYVNTLLQVTYKACVPHCQILLQWPTRSMLNVNQITPQRDFGFFLNNQGVMDTGIYKWKYHWSVFPEVLNSRSRGKLLHQMYNMVPYELKVMNIKNGVQSFYHTRQNRNTYPRE